MRELRTGSVVFVRISRVIVCAGFRRKRSAFCVETDDHFDLSISLVRRVARVGWCGFRCVWSSSLCSSRKQCLGYRFFLIVISRLHAVPDPNVADDGASSVAQIATRRRLSWKHFAQNLGSAAHQCGLVCVLRRWRI